MGRPGDVTVAAAAATFPGAAAVATEAMNVSWRAGGGACVANIWVRCAGTEYGGGHAGK